MMKDQARVTAYQTAIKEAVQFISGKVRSQCGIVVSRNAYAFTPGRARCGVWHGDIKFIGRKRGHG